MPDPFQQYGNKILSQCMTKGELWHDVILVRKEHYEIIAVYFSICMKPDSYEQQKTRGPGALCRAQEYHCNLALFFFSARKVHKLM